MKAIYHGNHFSITRDNMTDGSTPGYLLKETKNIYLKYEKDLRETDLERPFAHSLNKGVLIIRLFIKKIIVDIKKNCICPAV